MIKGFCEPCSAKLEREGKVCYGYMSNKVSFTADSNYCNQANATHRALLVCIEPISEPCKHPSSSVIITDHDEGGEKYYCKQCHQRVQPTAFGVVDE